MNQVEQYFYDRDERVRKYIDDPMVRSDVCAFMDTVHRTNYVKNWSWMGRPILQLPTDLMAIGELIWQIKPDIVIESGVAFGGMTMFCASILEIMHQGFVVGIDIDIRSYNRRILQRQSRIRLIQGDSVSKRTIIKLKSIINENPYCTHMEKGKCILVILDSNHSHNHVLQELRLYTPFVSLGSYIVVMDTFIEYLDPKYIPEDRPWGKGNNPMTAVREFMKDNNEFEVDTNIENRILLTSAPEGWLKRVRKTK